LKQILNEWKALLSVVVFPYRFRCAKLEPGLSPGLGGRHAGTQILFSLQGKMLGDLFLEALVAAPCGGEVRETNEEAAKEFHGWSSALISKNSAMMAVARIA
jgi:hypothetical protein